MKVLFLWIAAAFLVSFGVGCGPASLSWDPAAAAAAVIQEADANGDQELSPEELATVPGFLACLQVMDTDGNGQLSEEEITSRLQAYRNSDVTTSNFECEVKFQGAPLVGATVRLVPEPCFGDALATAEGRVDPTGLCYVKSDAPEVLGVPVGVYRVVIESDAIKIPARYNSETTLGVEIPPPELEQRRLATVLFELRGK